MEDVSNGKLVDPNVYYFRTVPVLKHMIQNTN